MGRQDAAVEPLRGLHVLVVDDDATARELIAGTLAQCGALVTQADSAEAARLSLARLLPELVVCALSLGEGRHAVPLLHQVRTMPALRGRHLPIVAIARDGDRPLLPEVLEAGFAGYVKAPFDPRALCALVADVADGDR